MSHVADIAPKAKMSEATEQTTKSEKSNSGFLVGPVFDLLFVANLYWPLVLVADILGGETWHGGMLFWQVYFVTAPHRWITLLLVGLDRNKTRGREWNFIAVTGGIVLGCLALQVSSASLLCLGAIDYVWNAWHFASQHHGIYRIYERNNKKQSVRVGLLEKVLFRGFLLYVIARVAGVGWHVGDPTWLWHLKSLDFAVCIVPLALLFLHWRSRVSTQGGMGLVYYASVMALFVAMLGAAHFEKRQLVLQLALASAVYHSVEYFAIVTWASATDSNRQRSDKMGTMARNWTFFVLFFIFFLGVTNYALAYGYEKSWILLNLIVAFLHYAYDGMIWKSRRPRKVGGAA